MTVEAVATAAERPRTKRRRSIMKMGSFDGSGRCLAGVACPVYCGAGETGGWLFEDKGLGIGHRREQLAGSVGAEYEDYGRECIAVGGAGIDDGSLQHGFDGAHCARVEDVAVAMSIFNEKLFGAGSGG